MFAFLKMPFMLTSKAVLRRRSSPHTAKLRRHAVKRLTPTLSKQASNVLSLAFASKIIDVNRGYWPRYRSKLFVLNIDYHLHHPSSPLLSIQLSKLEYCRNKSSRGPQLWFVSTDSGKTSSLLLLPYAFWSPFLCIPIF